MAFGEFLSSAAIIIALAASAGMGLTRGRITNLREQLEDADKQLQRQKQELTDARATIGRQASDIDALRRVVTGEVHWQAISDVLDHHHAAAELHWQRDEDLLSEIARKLDGKP